MNDDQKKQLTEELELLRLHHNPKDENLSQKELRSEERERLQTYEFMDFHKLEGGKGGKIEALVLDRSSKGCCCFYLGEEKLRLRETLRSKSQEDFRIQWVEHVQGFSYRFGVRKIEL